MVMRKRHTAEFKSKVAMESLKETRSAAELSSAYGVHPGMISQWKKAAKEHLLKGFAGGKKQESKEPEFYEREALLAQIGQLKVELDWLKKRL